jgi:hypothetical protein
MKLASFVFFLCLLWAGAAGAQNPVGPTPPDGDNSNQLATTEFVSRALAGFTKIPNNAALSGLASTYATGVIRLGFSAIGDAPPVLYTPTNSACSLHAGAGDGGSQVPTSDGKCWIANLPTPYDITIWGAHGDGTTNNAATIQSALNYLGLNGGTLRLPIDIYGGVYAFTTSGMTLFPTANLISTITGPGTLKPTPNSTGSILTASLANGAIGAGGRPYQLFLTHFTLDLTNATTSAATWDCGINLKEMSLSYVDDITVKFDAPNIGTGTFKANSAGVCVTQQNPADDETGSYWVNVRNSSFGINNGPGNFLPYCILVTGAMNAMEVINNKFGNCTRVTAAIPNPVTHGVLNNLDFNYNACEGITTCLEITSATGFTWQSGVRALFNRVESSTTFFSMISTSGSPGTPQSPPVLMNNYLQNGSVTNYIVNAANGAYSSLEPFAYGPYTGANAMYIGGTLTWQTTGQGVINQGVAANWTDATLGIANVRVAGADPSGNASIALDNGTYAWEIKATNGSGSIIGIYLSGTLIATLTQSGEWIPLGGVGPAANANGSLVNSPRLVNSCGAPAVVSTQGTDTANAANTDAYEVEIYVPSTMSTTGVSVFNGSVAAGNVTVYLADTAGFEILHTASTAQTGTATYQKIPWTASPTTIPGPGTYYLYFTNSGNTGTWRTFPVAGACATSLQTGVTYGTFPNNVPPTTFTTNVGPFGSLY